MSKIEKNTRVLIPVDKEFSSDKELTGRVVWHDEHACVFVLDPKYQNSSWGWLCHTDDVKEYSLSSDLLGQRVGIAPRKKCTSLNTVGTILQPTSQRRL